VGLSRASRIEPVRFLALTPTAGSRFAIRGRGSLAL